MNKRFLLFLVLVSSLFIINIEDTNALQTYVGVKILNLTDDPAHSCVGETGYGNQGRIRAISSIVGVGYPVEYPIYFELRYINNNSLVWSGNSIEDYDYGVGDIIQIPTILNMTSGVDYKLFFDIDAIKVYLPITASFADFSKTIDNLYWTSGYVYPGNNYYYYEYIINSNSLCGYVGSATMDIRYEQIWFSSNRSLLVHSSIYDSISYNADNYGLFGIEKPGTSTGFNIDQTYANLNSNSVGNFEFQFSFP